MPPPATAKKPSTSAIKPHQTMRDHTDWVKGVAHLPDGRRIITCSFDGSFRLWDLESGVQIGNDWRDDGGDGVWSMELSPNGKTFASGGMDGKIRLWDIETKKVVTKWTGHTDDVMSLCWSEDGERVVSGSNDGTIRVWDVESDDTVLGPINTGHLYVFAVKYSPGTTKIATGGLHDTALKIWDAKSGNLLSTIEQGTGNLVWTSDEKKLVAVSYTSIRIFDTATWQQIAILEGHTGSIYSLSLFQNDRLLASGSGDGTARLWNLGTNLPVGPPIQHEHSIRSVAISANGMLLVTGCDDKNVYVWDIHTTIKDAGLDELLSVLDDLTDHIQKRSNHPVASGSFWDIWNCSLVKHNEVVEVAMTTIHAIQWCDEVSKRKNSRRVLRELKAWRGLKHDCILPLWGVASNFGPYPAIISPWVLNGTLTDFLARQQDRLSSRDKFSLLNDIALGLKYLHSKSIVYGALTGSNVLVQDNGRACLAFGFLPMVLEVIGLSYITNPTTGIIRWAAAELFVIPEDDEDNTVVSPSVECDVYSFGSIALQVLTCKVPYYYINQDSSVLGQVIRGKKPQPPKESYIAPPHWVFIQRCWSSPAYRPTAAEVVAFVARERDALSF